VSARFDLDTLDVPIVQAPMAGGPSTPAFNLWVGEAHQLAQERAAEEVVAELAEEARRAAQEAAGRLAGSGGGAGRDGQGSALADRS
jgi:NAD(P)H-dependent flavin oxidoreductase YrpB (nitropropane dioxygenase family)